MQPVSIRLFPGIEPQLGSNINYSNFQISITRDACLEIGEVWLGFSLHYSGSKILFIASRYLKKTKRVPSNCILGKLLYNDIGLSVFISMSFRRVILTSSSSRLFFFLVLSGGNEISGD